jgi:hypothetical protein
MADWQSAADIDLNFDDHPLQAENCTGENTSQHFDIPPV